jgi:hypothetical protein
MADVLRRILYPVFVMTIVATIWTMGQAKAAGEAAERSYWAPLHPSITGVEPIDVLHAEATRDGTSYDVSSSGAASFNQVLLEDDEVVGVR